MSATTPLLRLGTAVLFLAVAVIVGCEPTERAAHDRDDKPTTKPAEVRKVDAGKNVVLEIQGEQRRVLVNAKVCLQQGQLELLLCRKLSKEHESILNADVDGRDIHKALLLAGAERGKPARYQEDGIKPPTGTKVKISLQYEHKGKRVTVPAGSWVRDMKTRKELKEDWVFAGSGFAKNVLDPKKPDIYLANDTGDLICVSNFEDAMLDLPIASSKDDAEHSFEAFSERIPDRDTKVVVILEPVLDSKKSKKK
jgi:hypothetical protein